MKKAVAKAKKRVAKAKKRVVAKVEQAVAKLAAWSFSRWGDYEQCPAKAKYKHVDHRREPDNRSMEGGTIVHRLGEQYLRGDLTEVPPEFKRLQKQMEALRKAEATPESEWAFTKDGRKVEWFSNETWVRMKIDAHHLIETRKGVRRSLAVRIVDYKTGKEKSDHAQQRSQYAMGAFWAYPDAAEVIVEHWYTETGVVSREIFKAKELERIVAQWEQRTRAMMSDTRFAPRPGNYCVWCWFSASKSETGKPDATHPCPY